MARIAKKAGTYHHGNLRSVLLEAAVRVIEKEGVSAVSLHALTRRAGVSSGAPYHHFASREQLLAAVAADGFGLLTREMQRAIEGVTDPLTQLEGLGRAYIRFAIGHRGHFRVMFRKELRAHFSEEERRVSDEAFDLLERTIARCQQAGSIAPGEVEPLALLAWSTVHGASDLWIDGSLSEEGFVQDGEALAASVASGFVRLVAGQLRR